MRQSPPEPEYGSGACDTDGPERLTPPLVREVIQLPDGRRLTLYSRVEPASDNHVQP